MRRACEYWLCGAILAGLALGCGGSDRPELAKVTGTVTLDGQPLPDAMVVFEPKEPGPQSIGQTDSSGHYELMRTFNTSGAVLGEHVVRITAAGTGENGKPVPEKVPVQYNHLSELTEEVIPGDNIIDFKLKSEGMVIQPHETEKLERLQYQAGR